MVGPQFNISHLSAVRGRGNHLQDEKEMKVIWSKRLVSKLQWLWFGISFILYENCEMQKLQMTDKMMRCRWYFWHVNCLNNNSNQLQMHLLYDFSKLKREKKKITTRYHTYLHKRKFTRTFTKQGGQWMAEGWRRYWYQRVFV